MRGRREFEEALAFGEEGEHDVARFLMRRGILVAPVYQFKNHDRAPVALYEADGAAVARVLPDLSCWWQGRAFFAEVKRKTRWTRWNGRRETGFDWRLFREYEAIRARSGVPLFVFFVHEQEPPTGVFVGRLARLAPGVRRWDGLNAKTGRRVTKPLALFPSHLLRPVRVHQRGAA